MAFGFSGSEEAPQMLGADIAITYIDGFRGQAIDYNITDKSPVCRNIFYFIYKIIIL